MLVWKAMIYGWGERAWVQLAASLIPNNFNVFKTKRHTHQNDYILIVMRNLRPVYWCSDVCRVLLVVADVSLSIAESNDRRNVGNYNHHTAYIRKPAKMFISFRAIYFFNGTKKSHSNDYMFLGYCSTGDQRNLQMKLMFQL